MPVRVSCHACNASFRIPDALYAKHFEGRQGKIWCKKCKALIAIDGRHAPPRNLSPTSLRAVTVAIDEQWPLVEIETSTEPSDSEPSISIGSIESIDAIDAPDTVDHTPTPVPVPVPTSEARASLPPVREKRWPVVLAIGAALAASFWMYVQTEGQADARAPAPIAAVAPVEPSIEMPAAAPEPALPEPAIVEPKVVELAAPEPQISKPNHDEAALNRKLRWAVREAENCHRGGRAAGTVHVTVRFAPTGRVASAVIDEEEIANAPVGRCIVAFMKAMVIPPFDGTELELSKEIALR